MTMSMIENSNSKEISKGILIFPDETEHLSFILGELQKASDKALTTVKLIDSEFKIIQKYMMENRTEIDGDEMKQLILLLNQDDKRGTGASKFLEKLIRLKDSPYFARIDFCQNDKNTEKIYYIGRYTFINNSKLLISDWRAPVANMFYDCEVGPARYNAPTGTIEGRLTRKRQFKIKNGKMEYAFESSLNVQDEILQRELSHTSDEKMKTIISTLQKEQNRIIRNESADTLIIQGVAGSGKTSIALHRVAYMLYRFKNTLTSDNIAILSPNDVFGDYISAVLPELGENMTEETSFFDIATDHLDKKISFENDKDPYETNYPEWANRVRFKSSLAFLDLMDKYLEKIKDTIFTAKDYSFGRFSVTAEWVARRYESYGKYPVKQRLKMLAEDIINHFEDKNYLKEVLPKPPSVMKSLTSMLFFKNTFALYKDFYRTAKIPQMLFSPAKNTLEWADVYPFLYFQNAFEGLPTNYFIKHLVVDEMQDYTPVQYAVLNQLYKCKKTILGDFGQSANPNNDHTLQDLCAVHEGAELIELNKSYRSSYEIIMLAKRIQRVTSLEPVERHGEEPDITVCGSREDEIAIIKAKIAAFRSSGNVTLGVILKTNSQAKEFYEALCPAPDASIQFISPESSVFKNGVSVTSVLMSKGLEFDEVIVPMANSVTYCNKSDRMLLYIACTRAMHRLSLTCTGKLTTLIGENASN